MKLSSWVMKGSRPSRVGYIWAACAKHSSTIARPIAIRARCCLRVSSLEEEFHLHAGELDDVVILEPVGRRADLLAVHVGPRRALDMGDEVALRPAREDRHLHARLAERGERLGELELLAGVRPREKLDRAERLAGWARRRRLGRRRDPPCRLGGSRPPRRHPPPPSPAP